MTLDQHRTGRSTDKTESGSLLDRLAAGESYAICFGGQGGAWLPTLTELVTDADLGQSIAATVEQARAALAPVADELAAAGGDRFEPLEWIRAQDEELPVPSETQLADALVSLPGILLTQLAAVANLGKQGLDTAVLPPSAVIGHSQGILATEAVAADGQLPTVADADLLAVAQIIGAASTVVARRAGLLGTRDAAPMISISGVSADAVSDLLTEYLAGRPADGPGLPTVAIVNSRRSVVLSGAPRHLAAFAALAELRAADEADARKRKVTGGTPFSPVLEDLNVTVPFHHPDLAPAVELAVEWAQRCGLDAELVRRYATAVLVDPVDWVELVGEAAGSGARWMIDLGPMDLASRLSAPNLRGQGVGVVAAATRGGQRNLFVPGSTPEVSRPWSVFAPRLISLPNGRTVVDTAFTRLTGRSPILLAGMTPTTVDPAIVAAAANAGHWAELAGGGQVTEEIFEGNVARLEELLDAGRQVQFNSLFLDPYLWKLQLGGKKLVQKARAKGAPFDGVIITAGIPELDEAVDLVHEFTEAGLHYVAFKPGTVDQIRQVVRIALQVPHFPIIVQVEGGRAGGHHSWEDLDDLLLATYAELRDRSNVVLCVGGGIGTPERASEYITGTWAVAHGYPVMPLDGILVGTAAMATLEATTAPEVKQLLVDTEGCDTWIGAGHAEAGMASGRSQLGADIHEIDNTASRTGRLLDEVAGDAEAVAERREEIIAALAGTAKPYFGDVTTMTYRAWLGRYAELATGADGRYGWADITWEQRFADMLRRTEARMNELDSGEFVSAFGDDFADPHAVIAALAEMYPAVDVDILHPADVAFFLDLCRTPGKPVNFVPVIDKDVRRWYRSDSLWQAHDARYSADEVCIIPGTVAVAGITEVDEPVGDLLNRFEAQVTADLRAIGEQPQVVAARRRRDVVPESGPLSVVIEAEDVLWAGRQVRNPIALLGDRDAWKLYDGEYAEHPSGAMLAFVPDAETADDEIRLDLVVPVSGSILRIPFTGDLRAIDGGSPRITTAGAADAMRELLTVAAGGELIESVDGVVTSTVGWQAHSVADHSGATASGLPGALTPTTPASPNGFAVPDTLVVACWPSVFSVIGAARTADGLPVVEGLLDLVHLDHAVELTGEIPAVDTELTVAARLIGITDSDVGRVVEVQVDVADAQGTIAVLTERFAIRGRTGAATLADPVRAGGAAADEHAGTRKHLRSATIEAPHRMNGFAVVSGDRNPIHTDALAARLAGLGDPIVHGMWLSAAAQQVLSAGDRENPVPAPRAIRGWTARYLGMVRLGDTVDIRVDRVGMDTGRETVELTAKVDGELVMAATALLDAPRTVYAFPGQGIQHKGMGLEARSRSAAAREIWDRADKHTREALGFSILAVVRDNPTTLVTVAGSGADRTRVTYHHPDGVLFLTQFTQVAMATLGVAQIAELRESGSFVDGSITCGHSVGEYNALAACAGVLPLEAVLEVVFQRGSAMHHLVPRDEKGRSDYRMAAIRPSQFGLSDADVEDFVAGIGRDADEFLEVVNLNLLGSQYAIAGSVRGLELLEAEIERRVAEFGGKRAFILVPGIDVPFHSTVLRAGVPEFRGKLEELLPADIDPDILVGRYIPNLVPRLFNLSREFVTEIAGLVPSDPLDAVLAEWDAWAARPSELTRVILIELLAWQFASPVRWIETQDLLFTPAAEGGLGIDRFVEVGVKNAPTLCGLARNTLKLPDYEAAAAEVLNVESDAAVLRAEDSAPEPVEDEVVEEVAAESAPAAAPAAAVPAAAPAAAAGPRPDDIAFGPADAVRAVISLWTKMTPAQIGPADTIEALCDGVSSRRNQLLLDVGTELGLGAIDGAAEADMGALASTVSTLARGYKPFGAVLTDAVGDQIRKVVGPIGKRASYITDRVSDAWQLGEGWGRHTLVAVALGSREGVSVRGGDLGDLLDGGVGSAADFDALIDRAVRSVGAARGIAVELPAAAAAGGGTVDAAALGEFTEQITGPDGVLAQAAHTILDQLGLTDVVDAAGVEADPNAELADLVSAELGSDWQRTVAPAFDEQRAVLLDDRWASAREDLARLWLEEAG
ncbi:fatty acid synthase subunit beta domain-containing protein, partial [Gordonia sp. (in: high G+C Gram-positive bacteria)]|uniref:fatty acid synthase subunit beta domain-containing protein n=1 Tax=Gordonia sp. (in: high G+C Gram-positive bacteria) TaxID=84139 RepID=UPI003C741729